MVASMWERKATPPLQIASMWERKATPPLQIPD
jgi:hypothetical protein